MLSPGMTVTAAVDDISTPLPIMRTPDGTNRTSRRVLEGFRELLALAQR